MVSERRGNGRQVWKLHAAFQWRRALSARRKPSRGGAVILEFILAMPVLFISFLAIFQFGFLALLIQSATAAVIEGAREGALDFAGLPENLNAAADYDPSGDDDIADRIALEMDRFLAIHNIEIRQNGVNDDADRINAYLNIVYDQTEYHRGDFANQNAGCTQQGDTPVAGEVVVTLCFPLVNQSNPSLNQPIPDWLSTFGFSFDTMHFEMTARAVLE
jgi:hypothetical protein